MDDDSFLHEGGSTVLACDVGGTNTSCALVVKHEGMFRIARRFRYATQSLSSFAEAVEDVFADLNTGDGTTRPVAACISAAGPVRNNRCDLTNVSWKIDGSEIASLLGIPVKVINDFTAVSYGIPLLDTQDAARISALAHPDGVGPDAEGTVRAVVGAGTGLGVGYVVDHLGEYLALPSEGGHSAFAPSDALTRELLDFVARAESDRPGAESFVSGRGIANILYFFRESGRIAADSPLSESNAPRLASDPARAVSEAAHGGDPSAIEIMHLFVENYARFASAVALHFLPLGGLYLAGGIVTKNERWFSGGNRFMNAFLQNYRKNIATLLHRIPVYVVHDYEVSLYGAAYSASLLNKETRSKVNREPVD